MAIEKQDFQAALNESGEVPNILPDELWSLYKNALHHASSRSRFNHPLSELLQDAPITVKPDENLTSAVKLMCEQQLDALPVVENGVLTGLITEGDLLAVLGVPVRHSKTSLLQKMRDYWYRNDPLTAKQAKQVQDLMTRSVITAHADDSIAKGIRLLTQHQVSKLLIVGEQKAVIGMISRRDLLFYNFCKLESSSASEKK